MTIEKNSMACARFVQLVRDFATNTKNWETAIRYETKPDERHDLTLVSNRVYGTRDEFLAIFAAAGLSSVDQPLYEQKLTLPNAIQLRALKEQAGYENDYNTRSFDIESYR